MRLLRSDVRRVRGRWQQRLNDRANVFLETLWKELACRVDGAAPHGQEHERYEQGELDAQAERCGFVLWALHLFVVPG